MKKRILILGALLVLLSGAFIWWQYRSVKQDYLLLASGTLESTQINLASRVGGRVVQVLSREGAPVKLADALVTFDLRELKAQFVEVQAREKAALARSNLLKAGSRSEDIQAAQAAFKAAEWRVQDLSHGSRQAEKDQAAAQVSERQSQLKLSESDWQRMEALFEAETISEQKLDQARQTLKSAQTALVLAQKSQELVLQGARQEEVAIAQQQAIQQGAVLNKVRSGVRPQEIQEAEATVLQIQAQLKQLSIRLEEEVLKSPCNCRISLLGAEPGELLAVGAPVLTLLDPKDLWVKVYLSPLELKFIALEQQVHLKVDAYPDRVFLGRVINIASEAEYTPRNIQTRDERNHQVFAIKIAVQEPEGQLFAGMPVDVIWPIQPTDSGETGL